MRQLGYPLYVNGMLLSPPVTISHVPGPTSGVDPSMGGLGEYFRGMGEYVSYLPTKGLGAAQVLEPAPVVPGTAPAPAPSSGPSAGRIILGVLGVASTAALAYHGYRRNQSIGWSLVWAIFGGGFPIIGWPVALAQGFGKSKSYSPNARGRSTPGWDVFLDGKKIKHVVHSRPSYYDAMGIGPADAAEVKESLVADGYDPRITVRKGKSHKHSPNPSRRKGKIDRDAQLVRLAGEAAGDNGWDLVSEFNTGWAGKLGDTRFSKDEAFSRFERAYNAGKKRRGNRRKRR